MVMKACRARPRSCVQSSCESLADLGEQRRGGGVELGERLLEPPRRSHNRGDLDRDDAHHVDHADEVNRYTQAFGQGLGVGRASSASGDPSNGTTRRRMTTGCGSPSLGRTKSTGTGELRATRSATLQDPAFECSPAVGRHRDQIDPLLAATRRISTAGLPRAISRRARVCSCATSPQPSGDTRGPAPRACAAPPRPAPAADLTCRRWARAPPPPPVGSALHRAQSACAYGRACSASGDPSSGTRMPGGVDSDSMVTLLQWDEPLKTSGAEGVARTRRTGTEARRTTASATLPRNQRARPPARASP